MLNGVQTSLTKVPIITQHMEKLSQYHNSYNIAYILVEAINEFRELLPKKWVHYGTSILVNLKKIRILITMQPYIQP